MTAVIPSSASRPLDDDILWAQTLARRLYLVLARGADESPEQRQAIFEQEVRRELEKKSPARRAVCLARLSDYFPSGASYASGGEAPAPTATADAEAALGWFIESWEKASPEIQETCRARLARAGVLLASSGGAEGDQAGLRQSLALGPNDTLATARLHCLFAMLADFLVKLEHPAWNAWKTLAPRSIVKREAMHHDIRLQLRRYLKGDTEPDDAQMAQQIERTRQLITVLLSSISQVGRGSAKKYQSRYSPDAVRELVKMEKGKGFLVSNKVRCWKKYCEMSAEIGEMNIQDEIQDVIVRFVEELMHGMKSGGG